ncbi:sigma-70 family RNA polymerase sigma factor [Simiduia aestuariiviva]|uniref:RNA polymerase sigma-70 factor (ECF subfamily) n=1 Tax=Simiduia aestuariiviva TaxID=1510459 RepID=A0A839USW2_9GAMM|nr:sigma-70 family RNA polymerase sigma factor [Simiduia aestuariiviva]MBB3169026.1 RNA polymerase sigma-70 factor (ECF subfamily) [Simiduia aestuariiviva]
MQTTEEQHLQLLSATSLGDRRAFEQLYQLTSGRLYAVALQLLRQRDKADDAVQEAFVKIWHNAGEYHHQKGCVLAWMISIVRYRALDMLRASKRRREDSSTLLPEIADHSSPDGVFTQRQDKARIDHCMERLDQQQRQAIALAYFNGYTHHEMCDYLASPLGSVKSWVRRGLEKLKRCLGA